MPCNGGRMELKNETTGTMGPRCHFVSSQAVKEGLHTGRCKFQHSVWCSQRDFIPSLSSALSALESLLRYALGLEIDQLERRWQDVVGGWKLKSSELWSWTKGLQRSTKEHADRKRCVTHFMKRDCSVSILIFNHFSSWSRLPSGAAQISSDAMSIRVCLSFSADKVWFLQRQRDTLGPSSARSHFRKKSCLLCLVCLAIRKVM